MGSLAFLPRRAAKCELHTDRPRHGVRPPSPCTRLGLDFLGRMKTPPLPEKAVPAATATRSERDRSFLTFAGVVLVALALGFKSELLAEGQVWASTTRRAIPWSPSFGSTG